MKGSKRHGFGEYIFQDKSIYLGNWYNDQMCGQGRFINLEGKVIYDCKKEGNCKDIIENWREKKKLRKKTAAEPEILGGFDYKSIGDRMMNELQRPHKDETEENQ